MAEPITYADWTAEAIAAHVSLLEKLSNAVGVSGDEAEVRAIVEEEVKDFADDVQTDALGNLLVRRKAHVPDASRLRVMVAAHMDEVGFMVVAEEEGGLYRFERVGGIDQRHVPGKAVLIGKNHVPGIIGARAIHLTTAEERRGMIPIDDLRLDIGLTGSDKNNKNSKGKVKVGDRATFATPFERLGTSLCGKALDNRLGVAILIRLIQNPPEDIELLAAFTTQEELGMRGARVAAYAFDPQVAVVVDATPANDLPLWDESENHIYNTRSGAGPALYVYDSATISNPRLVSHFAATADALGIPYQFRQPGGGGTDAGAIHRQRSGIPSLSISTPTRYIHTNASITRLDDWLNTYSLVRAGIERLAALPGDGFSGQ